MKIAEIQKLQKEAKELHKEAGSFRKVAETLKVTLQEAIYLIKADDLTTVIHFKENSK